MQSTRRSTGAVVALLGSLALLTFAIGCSGGSQAGTTSTTPLSAVQMKIGDAPADSVLVFELNIASASLQPQNGNPVSVLSAPAEIELAHLSGTLEPLALANVAPGTYTGASIAVSNAEVTYIPAGSSTPVSKQVALNQTVNLTFNPVLNVGSGSSVINLDMNLAQSLTFDSSGNLTGVSPVFTASTVSVPAGGEQGEDEEHGQLEDSVGQVTATTAAAGTALASFTITPAMNGQPLTFQVNSSTHFEDGLAQFSDLKANMMVKVDAVTQSDGSLLATKVELVEASDGMEAEGVVTQTTGNPATSFQLVVQDGSGSGMASSTLGTTVTVNVGSAAFRTPLSNSDDSNLLSGLPFTPTFDATTVAKGQSVEADAMGPMASAGTLNASRIQLRRQALSGTVGAAATGSNATFSLLLDADSAFVKLTGVTSINVYQVSKTVLKGVSSVAPGSQVKVRGLLFFDGTQYQFVAGTIASH
ncbi:MAG TPA: DUF5666 domain-containing protein [Terriglobales bacterium]|nr:DUF5666 domain-containing protein [Terriglobales bacterium]